MGATNKIFSATAPTLYRSVVDVMSVLKGLIDSLGAMFADVANEPPETSSGGAESSQTVSSLTNERIAFKLKGYFDLAKEEIDRAVKAEEWGLTDDAITHYNHARKILVEAGSTPLPTNISARYGGIEFFRFTC